MLQSLLHSTPSVFRYYLTAIPHSLSTEPKPCAGFNGELSHRYTLFRSVTAFQFQFKMIAVNSRVSVILTDSYSLFFSNLICYFKSIACIFLFHFTETH